MSMLFFKKIQKTLKPPVRFGHKIDRSRRTVSVYCVCARYARPSGETIFFRKKTELRKKLFFTRHRRRWLADSETEKKPVDRPVGCVVYRPRSLRSRDASVDRLTSGRPGYHGIGIRAKQRRHAHNNPRYRSARIDMLTRGRFTPEQQQY